MILPSFLTLFTCCVVTGAFYLAYKLCWLLVADADLHLLGKGPHKDDAFQGKVVWITGASQGLGEILAKYFAACGARLILSSRRRDKLEAVKAGCKARPEDVLVLPFDLSAPFAVLEAAAAAADASFGGLGVDFLVHNAGASQHALVEEISAEMTDSMFQLNALGPIKLTRAALPHMLRRGKGRFVVVSSAAGKVPSPGQAVYSACKMALQGYFASMASELSDRGVSVTLCCPGPVATAAGAAPRVINGPTGPVTLGEASSSSRISPERTAQLIANAAGHGVDECWISLNPVLSVMYLYQLVPRLGMLLLKRIGPKRARALKEGRSGYDVSSVMTGGGGGADGGNGGGPVLAGVGATAKQ